MLGRDGSPPRRPQRWWLRHSHHPVETSCQQLPAAPQGLGDPQRLVHGAHRALQSKGHCRRLHLRSRGSPGLRRLPHLPWLRCSQPPRPPWGQTSETQVPLEGQTVVTVLWGASLQPPSRSCGPTGTFHTRRSKPRSRSGFQAQEQLRRWRLSAALQDILEMWTKAQTACKAQCGRQPWSNSTRQGKTALKPPNPAPAP